MNDLRERVPGHSLIDMLLQQWDEGAIQVGNTPDAVVIDDEARGWFGDVLGERQVAQLLTQLGVGWTILHSVPVSDGVIDHVLIGPAGVFTISTKYRPGKSGWAARFGMYIAGEGQPYIHRAKYEAQRAGEALSAASGLTVPATALIVLVRPANITRKADAGDGEVEIRVIADYELIANLRGRAVFSSEQVSRIAAAAVKPETWRSSPLTSTDAVQIEDEFRALEAALGGGGNVVTRPINQEPVSSSTDTKTPPAGSRKPTKIEVALAAVLVPAAIVVAGLVIANLIANR